MKTFALPSHLQEMRFSPRERLITILQNHSSADAAEVLATMEELGDSFSAQRLRAFIRHTGFEKLRSAWIQERSLPPVEVEHFLCFFITEKIPILSYLARFSPKPPHGDDAETWEDAFRRGRLKIFHYFIGKHYVLSPGDLLVYAPRHPHDEPPVSKQISLLHEDEHLIAFTKPAHLPCHPSGAYFHHSLTQILERRKISCHFIHRLDAETSGIIIAVKNPRHVTLFSRALAEGEKLYYVLCFGETPDHFSAHFPLGMDPSQLVRKRQRRMDETGQAACTHFEKFKTFSTQTLPAPAYSHALSLLLASPETGRTHQIRVHLAESGFPVVGDKLYGPDETDFLEFLHGGLSAKLLVKLLLTRHFLHAYSISGFDPLLEKTFSFYSPLSSQDELSHFLAALPPLH